MGPGTETVLSRHTRGGTAGLPGAPGSSSGRDVPRAHLGDVGQADQVGDEADGGNEQLPAVAEQPGVLVHQCGDEALHRAELRGGGGQPPGQLQPLGDQPLIHQPHFIKLDPEAQGRASRAFGDRTISILLCGIGWSVIVLVARNQN